MRPLTVGPSDGVQLLAERCIRLDAERILRIRAVQDTGGRTTAVLEVYRPELSPAPRFNRAGRLVSVPGPVDVSIPLPLHALPAIAGACDRVGSSCGARR